MARRMSVEVSPSTPLTKTTAGKVNVDSDDEFSHLYDEWRNSDIEDLEEVEQCGELRIKLFRSQIEDSGIGSSQEPNVSSESNDPFI